MVNTASGAPTMRSYAAAQELEIHSHLEPRLCYVLCGNFEESIGTRRYERSRGMVLYRPAGLNHAEQFGRNGSTCGLRRMFVVDLKPEFISQAPCSVQRGAPPSRRPTLGEWPGYFLRF